ncbi:iron ABC transporter substrate-binding protein [Bacillus obstructivus]|nr:iron ABC transporter substrate-binding protein [Bacillus obstructivus]
MRKMIEDHLSRIVEYQSPPKRIISICPGITDTLYSLQLENEVVGRTKYCIFPKDKVSNASVVGGTKQINLQVIRELKPDLIIAEKEENTKEIVEELEREFPVFVAEIQSIKDAYRMIRDIGEVTNREELARTLIERIKYQFQEIPSVCGKRVAYVIWRKPYMVVGNDTYIHSVLEKLGFINPFATKSDRYPIVTIKDFQDADLDFVFLATEPFPYSDKYKQEFMKFIPNVVPIIVEGEMFWYGPRMLEASKYFSTFLNKMVNGVYN